MKADDFERLNILSEKAINDNATLVEMKEFTDLLDEWNSSVELNLFGGFYNDIRKYN